jgi:hypothetical protein
MAQFMGVEIIDPDGDALRAAEAEAERIERDQAAYARVVHTSLMRRIRNAEERNRLMEEAERTGLCMSCREPLTGVEEWECSNCLTEP